MLPETHLPKGMRGVIRCPSRANPPLLSVTWTRDGRPLELDKVGPLPSPLPFPPSQIPPPPHPFPLSQLPGWSVRPDGSIVIATGNDDALGLYRCTPYNSYGTAGESRPTRVLLKVRSLSGSPPGSAPPDKPPKLPLCLAGPSHLHGAAQRGIFPGGGPGAGDPLCSSWGSPTHRHLGEGRGCCSGGSAERLLLPSGAVSLSLHHSWGDVPVPMNAGSHPKLGFYHVKSLRSLCLAIL